MQTQCAEKQEHCFETCAWRIWLELAQKARQGDAKDGGKTTSRAIRILGRVWCGQANACQAKSVQRARFNRRYPPAIAWRVP
mmetsp:Transcript_7462/g.22094  ORF Transcript_7462/g.22094 Transcript_7462/m.22094 type:complete len:82 (+) Transcript_7462:1644-1889(+)